MGAPKPCLGYPSRTEAVIGLRAEGKKPPEIAAMIGISEKTVWSLLWHGGHAWKRRAAQLALPKEIVSKLAPAAAARGLKVDELCLRLLRAIAEDNMADAVLDDEVASL